MPQELRPSKGRLSTKVHKFQSSDFPLPYLVLPAAADCTETGKLALSQVPHRLSRVEEPVAVTTRACLKG